MSDSESIDEKLPVQWRKVQTGIWLVGLAILAWQGWWWPGILILVAISSLFQALVYMYVRKAEEEKQITQTRQAHLPANCPNCGSPITSSTVTWISDTTAICPYCKSNIKATESAQK